MSSEIFISYRRDSGAAVAQLFSQNLCLHGYKVFLDITSMQVGYFDQQIFEHIDASDVILLILSRGALDRCKDSEDWVRKEIIYALKQNKKIIPLFMSGFSFPDILSEDLECLSRMQGINVNFEYFNEVINKLCKLIENCDVPVNPHSAALSSDTADTLYINSQIKDVLSDPDVYLVKKQAYIKLFSEILEQEFRLFPDAQQESLMDGMINLLMIPAGNHAIKFIGPTGSDVDTFIQLLYLQCIEYSKKGNLSILPFYINLHKITEGISADPNYFERIFMPLLLDYLSGAEKNSVAVPVIFITDIAEYDWETDQHHFSSQPDFSIEGLLQSHGIRSRIRYVISVNEGYSQIGNRDRGHIPFDSSDFNCVYRVHSIRFSSEPQMKKIVEIYHNIYGIESGSKSVEELTNNLYALKLGMVDMKQIYYLDHAMVHNLRHKTLSALYQAECECLLKCTAVELSKTAEIAYQIAYGAEPITEDFYATHVRELMYQHKSFIEYLIARHYISSFSASNGVQDIHRIVLPKNITSFIVEIFKSSVTYENTIIEFCNRHYDELTVHGKSQIAYLLGRIQTNNLRALAQDILERLEKKEADKLDTIKPTGVLNDVRQQMFLIRSISVSLIYMGAPGTAERYIHSLMSDHTAADINRGFHLEYYGDIEYNPVLYSLCYQDDTKVGQRSIARLIGHFGTSDFSTFNPGALNLNLFSLCSILQARIDNNTYEGMKIYLPYIENTILILDKYLCHPLTKDPRIIEYFEFFNEELRLYMKSSGDEFENVSCRIYNDYSSVKNVKRAGWVKRGIPDSESIAEHMYNAWQLGLFFLPEKYSENEYNKNTILKMILIHDLGEVVVDDATPEDDTPARQNDENRSMRKLFWIGTYPSVVDLDEYYNLWDEWYQQKSLNALIAKDLDEIQCCCQACRYHLLFPERLSIGEVISWIKGYKLRTDLGRKILKSVVLDNPAYRLIFK